METLSPEKILLIDDDLEVLQVLKMSLESEGFEATISASTAEAEKLLMRSKFDLVVCDVSLPYETGYDFKARMMLKDVNLPPFLYCSGAPEFDLPSHIADGVVGLLPKPFTIPELINTLRLIPEKLQ